MYFGNRFEAGGEPDPAIKLSTVDVFTGKPTERVLSIARTALVYIEEEPGHIEMLECNAERNGIGDIHVLEPGDDILVSLVEADYPRIFSPTRRLFEFWRRDANATDEMIEDEYGYVVASWRDLSKANGPDHPFTFFSAMKRTFGDRPEADHTEIRNPAASLAPIRMPIDEFVRVVDRPGWAPRSQQFVELWLPRLAMDKAALKWREVIEAKEAEEFEESIKRRVFEIEGEVDNILGQVVRAENDAEFQRIIENFDLDQAA